MITVSPARPDSVHAIAVLLEEMDRFYGSVDSEPLSTRIRQIDDALFSDPPAAYALLARDGGDVVGLATYSFLWPAVGLTRSLYLKELYVTSSSRRRSVGKLLMRALSETAGEYGCSRVEWTTDMDNTDAQAFYQSLGLSALKSKVFYRSEMIAANPTGGHATA